MTIFMAIKTKLDSCAVTALVLQVLRFLQIVGYDYINVPRVQNPWSGGAGFERNGPLRLFFKLRSTAPRKFLDT